MPCRFQDAALKMSLTTGKITPTKEIKPRLSRNISSCDKNPYRRSQLKNGSWIRTIYDIFAWKTACTRCSSEGICCQGDLGDAGVSGNYHTRVLVHRETTCVAAKGIQLIWDCAKEQINEQCQSQLTILNPIKTAAQHCLIRSTTSSESKL